MSSEDLKPKRKTRTSSAVKNRYNAKTYKKFQAYAKPDLYQRIEEYTPRRASASPNFSKGR